MRKIPRPYTDPTPLFRHGGGPPGLLDFSASINPLGPPKSVLRAIKEGLADIARYPDPDCRELTARLAADGHLDPSQIVVGNGSNELIYAIARAIRPKRVAIAEPTYTEYLRASLVVGAEIDHWLAEGNHFKLKPFDPQGADLVWLCNPNNPTGGMWGGAAYLGRWMQAHPRTVFVVDEAFLPLWWMTFVKSRSFPRSLIHFVREVPNLIVLRSMTKFYALAGLRLGYAVCSQVLAERLRAQLPSWSVNSLALVAGIAALQDEEHFARTGHWIMGHGTSGNGRLGSYFRDELRTASSLLYPIPSEANFVLVRLRGITSDWLAGRLEERGIAVRDASNFVGLDQRYLRVGLRTVEENGRLIGELRKALAERKQTCPAP